MPLTPGTRIGSYAVLSAIGAGGMGEVYRARDTKLQRDVAIKVLPELFAADADRLARFEREAQTLATLNHPHIAQIYGVTESPAALVMELVDGEDLSQRIARGALPLDEALPIAREIAAALEAAHEAGIIHRDLKPANVKVRPDGTVKVLDFGLAKAMDPGAAPSASNPAVSPTMTSPAMTAMGIILGTAAYMAPEQARGRAVDKRADIWAFGCVLFEMLAGRRPFPGEDVSDTLAAVLKSEADWPALPPSTPPHVLSVLRACLQKDPRRRLRDIGDARLQLEAGPQEVMAVAPVRSRTTAVLPWAVAAVCALAAAIAVLTRPAAEPAAARPIGMVVPAPPDGTYWNPMLSRDGSLLVFGGTRIHVRRLSDFSTRALPGSDNGVMPFFSRDGRWIGFFADEKIKKVAVSGGDPVDVTSAASDTPGGAWGVDDRIYFSPGWNNVTLMSVSADGGPVTPVSTLDRASRERGHWWPEPLPDGRHLLFTIWYEAAGVSESKIAVLDLQTGTHRVLFPGAQPRYAAGHLLYFRAGSYYVVPFDAATRTTTGDPVAVLPDALVLGPQGTSMAPVSLSDDGSVAYMAAALYPTLEMTWIDRDGRRESAGFRAQVMGAADLSPDGRRVAFGRPQGGSAQVVVVEPAGGGERRLAAAGMNWTPLWHPSGDRVAYLSMRKGDFDTYVQGLDGSPEVPIAAADIDEEPVSWLPDGRQLVLKAWQPDGSSALVLHDPDRKTATPVVTGQFQKWESRLSSDGKWLAVVANVAGRWHVHVASLRASASFPQVSPNGVLPQSTVRWSAGSDRLFYLNGGNLVGIAVTERQGRLEAGREEVVAELPRNSTLVGVHPDGRVLVGIPTAPPAGPPGFHVLVNGLSSLMRP